MECMEREIIYIPATGGRENLGRDLRQKRVAAYCRVSTDTDEQLNSFQVQKTYYTEMIMKKPEWKLADIYADEGISGATAEKRPDFIRMIRHCRKGKIDLIVTKSISRFARNTLDSVGYVRRLKAMGIGVIFEKENINTLEDSSEVVLTILSALAQEELNSHSKNVKMGKRMAAKEGKVSYQYRNFYGYQKGKDGKPEIIPEQANHICDIFKGYLAGQTTRAITVTLNENNVPYFEDKPWSEGAVRSILANEKYCGDVLLQKTYVTDPFSKKVKKNNGELPKTLIKNNHPAIISREIFERVQAERTRRSSKKKVSDSTLTENGKYSSRYALSEILVCGHCGSPYRRTVWTKRDKSKQAVWRCISRLDHGTKYCPTSPTMDEEDLQRAIMGGILTAYNPEKIIPFSLTNELKSVMRSNTEEALNITMMEGKISNLIEQTMGIVMTLHQCTTAEERENAERRMKALSDEAKALQERVDYYKATNETEEDLESRLEAVKEHLVNQPQDALTYNDVLVRQTLHTIQVMDTNRVILHFRNGESSEQILCQKVRKLRA